MEKVNEANFFKDKIDENYSKFPDVEFYFNAFLHSCYSIPNHLLEDYNKKFGLGIIECLNVNSFKEKAKKLDKTDAVEFISWYSAEVKKLNSTLLGEILRNKRHQSAHRHVVPVLDFATLTWGNFLSKQQIEQIKLANPQLLKTVVPTEEFANVELYDVVDVLRLYIDMVSEASRKFPNELLQGRY